jgi:hypothetical protein
MGTKEITFLAFEARNSTLEIRRRGFGFGIADFDGLSSCLRSSQRLAFMPYLLAEPGSGKRLGQRMTL